MKKKYFGLVCLFVVLLGCVSSFAYSASGLSAVLTDTEYSTYDFDARATANFSSSDITQKKNNPYYYVNVGADLNSYNFWRIRGFSHNGTADITWAQGELPRQDGATGKGLYSRVRQYNAGSSKQFTSHVDLEMALMTGTQYSKRCALKYGYFTQTGDVRTLVGTVYANAPY